MNRRYKILSSLPSSGPMYIPVTDDDKPFYSEGFVVKIFRSDGSNWVGNFKPGWTNYNDVYEFSENKILVIIAGGLVYIMDPDIEKPIFNFGLTVHEVLQTSDKCLIFSDGIHIIIFDGIKNKIWESERISWDGIKHLSIENNILKGLSYDPTDSNNEWNKFSIDLQSKQIIGGSFRRFLDINKKTYKPWWKIW